MKLKLIYYSYHGDIFLKIQECDNQSHFQQCLFSRFRNAIVITQVCFSCKKIRTNYKDGDIALARTEQVEKRWMG